MLFLIALAVAILLVLFLSKPLKKHPNVFYFCAVAIMVATILIERIAMPDWVKNYVLALFTNGALAGAIWIIVMWAGALPNGGRAIKKIMPIRGELSIFAAILTFTHNIIYGRSYFVRLFTDAENLPLQYLIASILSLCMLVIMIPLTVLSFPRVRKKLPPKRWKRIQRLAYGFYAMLYIHIMLVMMGGALRHRAEYIISVIVYTVVFSAYLFCRVRKWYRKKHKITGALFFNSDLTLCCVAALLILALPIQIYSRNHSADKAEAMAQGVAVKADDTDDSDEAKAEEGDRRVLTGSAFGYDDDIVATVTLEGDTIVDISAITYEEDPSYLGKVKKTVIRAILEKQSTDISEVLDMDAVSGATTSAKGLVHAVENAISQSTPDDDED